MSYLYTTAVFKVGGMRKNRYERERVKTNSENNKVLFYNQPDVPRFKMILSTNSTVPDSNGDGFGQQPE